MKLLYISMLACVFVFMGCKKTDSASLLNGNTFVVNATSETEWVYFSFDTNDTVQIANPAASTDWDLAFRRFNIETNSGVSGKANGGAANSGKTSSTGFSQVIAVSDTATFVVDDSISVQGAYGNLETVAANSLLSNWYNYDFSTNTLSSKNIVYIVRTASGKYAKLQILNYYSDKTTAAGYVKFTYVYQPDGSKNLQ